MKFKAKSLNISKESILSKLSEEEIFNKYFPHKVETGRMFTNPFRKDVHPGCQFYRNGSSGERIIFYDFAKSKAYDCFSIVMEKYGVNFWNALKKITEDFNLNLDNKYSHTKIKKEAEEILDVKKPQLAPKLAEEFSTDDLDYWKSYGITEDTLNKFNVKSALSVYLKDKLIWRATNSNPIFIYQFPSERIKCYRPLSKNRNKKWLSNTTKEDIQGYEQLPFLGDTVFITSSLKDVMTLHELGYPAIAPQSESANLPKSLIESLQATFKQVVIFYDSDGEFFLKKGESGKGKRAAYLLSKKYDLPLITTEDAKNKDISDYVKEHGQKKAKQLISSLIKNPLTWEKIRKLTSN